MYIASIKFSSKKFFALFILLIVAGKQLERYFFPILTEVMHCIPLLHFAALVTPTNDICKLRRNFKF